MNQIINELPSNQDSIFNRVLLDLFVQFDTKQEEIDINPFIQFFKLHQNPKTNFESLLSQVIKELSKSKLDSSLLNSYTINQKESSNKTPIDELIIKSNITIKPSKYFFIQFSNPLQFDFQFNLELSKNDDYDLFAMVVKNSDDEYSILLKNDKGSVKITKDEIYEIDDIDFERINTKRIICLGYTQDFSYFTLDYSFYSQKVFSIQIFVFLPSTMSFHKIVTRENITRSHLKKKLYQYLDDDNYTSFMYQFDDDKHYHDLINEKIEFKKLNMYIEKKGQPSLLKSYIDCLLNNETKTIVFNEYKNASLNFSGLFHIKQSANVIYSFLKLALQDVNPNPKINLFAKMNKEYILIPKDKSLAIENIFNNNIDQTLFFTLDGSKPNSLKKFGYYVIPKTKYKPESHKIDLEINQTGAKLIKTAQSESKILAENEIEHLILFYRNKGVIELFSPENELTSIPSSNVHMQIMKYHDFFFVNLAYYEVDDLYYTNAIFAFHRVEGIDLEDLKSKLSQFVGIAADKFDLVMRKNGELRKLKRTTSIISKSTVYLYLEGKNSLPNLVDA